MQTFNKPSNNTYSRAEFYFSAHADDWQLFMDPEVGRSITDKECRVVIIHTTAGDAGLDDRYWKAREAAALESILFRISTDPQILRSASQWKDAAGRNYELFALNNCIAWFLRLPDGAYDGTGFPRQNNQSLDKFRTGTIASITSVDNQTIYADWPDLAAAIDNIIDHELSFCSLSGPQDVCLNIPEFDKTLNPHDHNDHFNSALLVSATRAYQQYKKKAFLTYQLKHSDRLLTGDELFWKIGLFTTYHQSLFREYGHSTMNEDASFIPWCFRNTTTRDL